MMMTMMASAVEHVLLVSNSGETMVERFYAVDAASLEEEKHAKHKAQDVAAAATPLPLIRQSRKRTGKSTASIYIESQILRLECCIVRRESRL